MSEPSSQSKPSSGGSAKPPQRDISAVAADLAIQQENEGLRLALREQERIVEELTNECRRLEDRLEDRYQDIDALRRELDRAKKHSNEQSSQIAGTNSLAPGAAEPIGASDDDANPIANAQIDEDNKKTSSGSERRHGGALGFTTGLLSGIGLAASAVAGLWLTGILMLASQAPGASTVTELLAQTPESAAASQDSPAVEGQANPASTPAPDETATNAAGTQPAPEPEQTAAISPAAQAPIPATTLDTPPAATPDNEDLQVPAEPVSGTHVDDFLNENAQAPELIALKASEFMMGNPVGPPDSDARPVHKVSLDAFMIGAKEVTFADYDRYVRATGARRPQDYGWGRGSRPVIDVTWQEAQDYAAWLSEQTGKPYRLPTEAEWEYAARGGTTSSYWWGIGSPSSRALCVNCGTRWDKLSTAPVGSFPPNAFGLYDTAGNVYEWTQDCYHQNYKKAASDGAARTKPGCELRVARGGSFNSPASAMRSHARNHFTSDSRIDMLGFRIARDLYPSDDN